MKKQTKSLMFIILNTTLVVSLLSVGIAYAWFPSIFQVGRDDFNPGDLDSDSSYSHWNKSSVAPNKWEVVSALTPLNVDLGEMITIDQLPAGTENYFKFKMNEAGVAKFNYNVILETLEIRIDTNVGFVTIIDIDYYNADPSQKVFDYYYVLDLNDNLNPTTLFADTSSMTIYQVTAESQMLTTSEIAMNQYLYVMMIPRLVEIQNIIDRIPIAYSPYSLEFNFTFLLEKRTIDEI